MAEDLTETIEAPVSASLQDEVSEEQIGFLNPIVALVNSRFNSASTSRQNVEERWMSAYQNYRGIYDANVRFLDAEKSRVFIKITKTKVLAAYGQILDVLFAEGNLPITIEPTEKPLNVPEEIHVDANDPILDELANVDVIGFAGDEEGLLPGESLKERIQRILSKAFGKDVKTQEGFSKRASAVNRNVAEEAAKNMERLIHDQLSENGIGAQIRRTIFEQVLLGTGVLKGPFLDTKEYPRWTGEGAYDPILQDIPGLTHTSVWNIYPDGNASMIEDAEFVIERHLLTKSQVRTLANLPHFRKTAIDDLLEFDPNFVPQGWEHFLQESDTTLLNTNRYEILEYWGTLDKEFVETELGDTIEIPPELEDFEELQVNVWVSGNHILRLVLNPFIPRRIPYLRVPYEDDPYNFFGIGLAENMEDSQMLMNGFVRLAVDNAVLSNSIMLEVDETNLVPGQDMSIYTGKIWRRQGGPPGQAIFSTSFTNTAPQSMQIYQQFRQLADEETGIPSFSHGQTGVTGIGRTASGISMLMGAASVAIKTVIRNVDDFLITPLGNAMFAFNMQFNRRPEIMGDLAVKTKGTSGLLQKELKVSKLLQFIQITSGPTLAPKVNLDYIIGELAAEMGLDRDKVIRTELDLQLAEILANAEASAASNTLQNTADGNNPAATPSINDVTGGGGANIGFPTSPAVPGQEGFAGNSQPTAPIDQGTGNDTV